MCILNTYFYEILTCSFVKSFNGVAGELLEIEGLEVRPLPNVMRFLVQIGYDFLF